MNGCMYVYVYTPHLFSELSTANSEYTSKLAQGKGTDKVLRNLVDDLSHLNEGSRKMHTESQQISELAEGAVLGSQCTTEAVTVEEEDA